MMRLQVLQIFQHLGGMGFGLGDLAPVFDDLAFFIDDHRGADAADAGFSVEHLFAPCAILRHHLCFRVGEQGEGQLEAPWVQRN